MSPILPRVIPFCLFIALLAVDQWLQALAPALGVDPRWTYAVRAGLTGCVLAWFWRRYTELGSVRQIRGADWLLAIAVGIVVFILWINLDFKPLTMEGGRGYDPSGQNGSIAWGLAVTRLLGAVAVVPAMEELFWRSFLLRWIANRDFLKVAPAEAGSKALTVSAIFFGFEHNLWFAGILAGFAYGWLYMRTGNLWAPIIAHAVTNAMLGAWVLKTGNWEFW